jgi:hypothetical protein
MTQLKKIAYTRPDGGLSIVGAASKENLEQVLGPLTDEQYEAHVWERSIPPDAINPHYIEDDDIPKKEVDGGMVEDRYFRNAWKSEGGKLAVDMEKARDVQMDKIRFARDQELEVLDKETLKGIDVQAEKQVLRDIPQTFDLTVAETLDDLRDLWPEELIERKPQ